MGLLTLRCHAKLNYGYLSVSSNTDGFKFAVIPHTRSQFSP